MSGRYLRLMLAMLVILAGTVLMIALTVAGMQTMFRGLEGMP